MAAQKIERVAVLGAGGAMGFAIAQKLCEAAFEVRAWNRSRKRAEPLAEHGAVIAGSPAEAAAHADAVLTLLADADAVLPVASEAFVEEQRDYQPLWPQMSTIGEQGTKRCGN